MLKSKIAVLGTGVIGRGIIKNLQKKGYHLSIYNRTYDKANDLPNDHTQVFKNHIDAIKDADIILSFLSDDKANEEIWLGEKGVVYHIKKDTYCINGSTLSEEFIDNWQNKIYKVGGKPLVMPLTGSKSGADSGTLTLFLGGNKKDIENIEHVYSAISSKTFYIGTNLEAMRFKLVYNALGGLILLAFSEILNLSHAIPMKKHDLLDILLKDNGWATPVANSKGKRMISNNHNTPDSVLYNMIKDCDYALKTSKTFNGYTPLLEQAVKIYNQMNNDKALIKDMSYIDNYYESHNKHTEDL
ncbi:hypothetical protein COJ07_01135 [Bacillus cereus]|uniref:NAD(P)-dependent oxidoreductase n=1 Tax=Bacillus cereus TaxID=1396 RepID=A0A2B3TUB9_BACCE|nr:NAD(P)-binding domain-containing protein [Bacillus cereus]PFL25310.1 hypothetical protein COJ07_01135 [Bacillus cereus]PFU37809.1 hypothetical protein COK86_27330 [Bacillus cereus]